MKNRLIVFSKSQIKTCYSNILLELGHNNFSVFVPSSFDECVSACQQPADVTLVLCDNQLLDNLLDSIKKENDNFEIFMEQAVKLTREEQKMLFAPLEIDPTEFFRQFLGEEPVQKFSIFGKTLLAIENVFSSIRCDYKIITKSPILHTIYCFGEVNVDIVKSALGDSLYSLQNEGLDKACARALKNSGKSLSVVEQATGGLVCSALNRAEPGLVKNCFLLFDQSDFANFGVPEDKLSNFKDISFATARELMKKCEGLTLSVVGEGNKFYISVGSGQDIHVFSTTFEGKNDNVLSELVDFALFRTLKSL